MQLSELSSAAIYYCFMKNKFSIFSDIIVFIAGLLLVALHAKAQLLETIIIIVGIMFIVSSVVTFISLLTRRRDPLSLAEWSGSFAVIPAVGGLILGIAMLSAPTFFVGFIAYTFAILLIAGGLFKLWILFSANKNTPALRFPTSLFAIPTLMLVAGIVILFTGVRRIEQAFILITGIFFIAYAVNSLLEYIVYRKVAKSGFITSDTENKTQE